MKRTFWKKATFSKRMRAREKRNHKSGAFTCSSAKNKKCFMLLRKRNGIKSVHFKKIFAWSSFLSKFCFDLYWKVPVRNEDRAIVFLKWTDFSYSLLILVLSYFTSKAPSLLKILKNPYLPTLPYIAHAPYVLLSQPSLWEELSCEEKFPWNNIVDCRLQINSFILTHF